VDILFLAYVIAVFLGPDFGPKFGPSPNKKFPDIFPIWSPKLPIVCDKKNVIKNV
jgi:hypothetical protein